jgi:hypothetical protein
LTQKFHRVELMKEASTLFAVGAVLMLLLHGSLSPASAQDSSFFPWTAVGSTGVTDSTDIGNVLFTTSIASISPNANLPVTATLRYNVVAVSGVVTGGDGILFAATFRDNGPGARVTLRLRRVSLATGLAETIATLDSNQYPPSGSFQVRGTPLCGQHLNFFSSAYYVEVDIRKTTLQSAPALAGIMITSIGC